MAKLAADEAADATDKLEPNELLIEVEFAVIVCDDGLAEHIAFNNFNIPSSIRISKSILLFNSSFY